jgi:hypothetical protein
MVATIILKSKALVISNSTFQNGRKRQIFTFFAFPVNNEVEFVCVSDEVLRSRFQKLNRIQTGRKKAELTLWLMPDGCLYDCTNISAEGEWYHLSSGVDGRTADDSEWDYTKYLNNWQELVESFGI